MLEGVRVALWVIDGVLELDGVRVRVGVSEAVGVRVLVPVCVGVTDDDDVGVALKVLELD